MDHDAFTLDSFNSFVIWFGCIIAVSLWLKKALKGVRVVATHRRDKSVRYRITGLTAIPLNDLTYVFNSS